MQLEVAQNWHWRVICEWQVPPEHITVNGSLSDDADTIETQFCDQFIIQVSVFHSLWRSLSSGPGATFAFPETRLGIIPGACDRLCLMSRGPQLSRTLCSVMPLVMQFPVFGAAEVQVPAGLSGCRESWDAQLPRR